MQGRSFAPTPLRLDLLDLHHLGLLQHRRTMLASESLHSHGAWSSQVKRLVAAPIRNAEGRAPPWDQQNGWQYAIHRHSVTAGKP